jgi:hypothetical protein
MPVKSAQLKAMGKIKCLTGTQTKLTAMKKKYTPLPNLALPMGQIWETRMLPMEPPEAAKLRPLARTEVGKI